MLLFQPSFVNGSGPAPREECGQAVLGASGDGFCSTSWLLGGRDSWPKWGAYERGSRSPGEEPSCSLRR